MDDAHEIDVEHAAEQLAVGFREGYGFDGASVRDYDVDRLPRRGGRNCRPEYRLIRDVRDCNEMRSAVRHRTFQGRPIATDDRNCCASLRQGRRNFSANTAPAAGHQRMRGMRQSRQCVASRTRVCGRCSAYILTLKFLQESAKLREAKFL
jgi:hypothetical protein